MIKLSIIVPVYNTEAYLERCINSLLSQDISINEYEVILIDDGSKDTSGDICDKYSQKYSNIIVIHKVNGGAASARNVGLDIAKGKYIMFVDSDDCIKNNVLKRLLISAEKFEAEICAYEMEIMDKSENIKYNNRQNLPFNKCTIYDAEDIIYSINISSICEALYLHSYLNSHSIRFTEGIVNEDVDFNNRAYSLVKKMIFTDILVYRYYWNSDSVNRSCDIVKIKKRTLDDLQVSFNSIIYAEQNNLSHKMIKFFKRKANSLVVSQLLGFILRRIPNEIKSEYIYKAKSLGLLPIKGRALNWKTTVVGWGLNVFIH